ncbi:ankyrin repeat domain containing protein, putative [Babesia bigemina]|uniref:Ankyrin repeat domain containing protein, putative n=1 Tax=Babesia bigemina TaxID=5866 RepID=A0A061DCP7_BABBI|nr:ankyrin repeat domain containing protein, putative [Babesia bigemina]CDR96804.1 ankyrin repeat domain containing protein, putative [Babesia bigemina]|eukprot:XP_012768990.1 ankyrin repeat domain containing protein, putative [Babesia bigemina]
MANERQGTEPEADPQEAGDRGTGVTNSPSASQDAAAQPLPDTDVTVDRQPSPSDADDAKMVGCPGTLLPLTTTMETNNVDCDSYYLSKSNSSELTSEMEGDNERDLDNMMEFHSAFIPSSSEPDTPVGNARDGVYEWYDVFARTKRHFLSNFGYDEKPQVRVDNSAGSGPRHAADSGLAKLVADRTAPRNALWKWAIPKLERFLDAHDVLMLRQTCVDLYRHKYTLRPHNELCFRGFVGYDMDVVIGFVIPLLAKVYGLTDGDKLGLDFSQCYNLKDISIVRMLSSQAVLNSSFDTQMICRNMRMLTLDYCHQITDKGLEVMLATKLPNLEKLSMVCCRNENITGAPFTTMLSEDRWPRLARFNCSFSNVTLEPIEAVANFIHRTTTAARAQEVSDELHKRLHADCTGYACNSRRWNDIGRMITRDGEAPASDGTAQPSPSHTAHPRWQLEITGCWGSRMFLDKHGFGAELHAFASAVKMKSIKICSKLTKRVQRGLQEMAERSPDDVALQLVMNRGSELLVNCPIVEHDRHNTMDMWTLPISITIQNDDMELCNLLIRRGARVNVWDYCGKSPLYKACEMGRTAFVKLFLKLGQAPMALDDNGFSPIAICVKSGNSAYVKLLLKAGVQLNLKCPHIRDFKSPLYIACEAMADDCIRLLLEGGADPNWLYHGRLSVTLLAYQHDKSWLPVFLKYGAGKPLNKRWILTDVLSCAIKNGNRESAAILVSQYPDLLERKHNVWSTPLVQAARLGEAAILQTLLDAGTDLKNSDMYETTPMHAAAEEGRLECLRLLVSNGADINARDIAGRTPLYLAVLENQARAVELLLSLGCDANAAEFSNDETPLMAALGTRNEDIALLIISKAKDLRLDAVDKLGRSASLYALYFEQIAVGEAILHQCAQLGICNSAVEIRLFNAVICDRIKARSANYKHLTRYAKHYRDVNAHVIRDNRIDFLFAQRWPLVKSLIGRIRGLAANP